MKSNTITHIAARLASNPKAGQQVQCEISNNIVSKLREYAGSYEKCGNALGWLDEETELQGREHICILRAAAAEIEKSLA